MEKKIDYRKKGGKIVLLTLSIILVPFIVKATQTFLPIQYEHMESDEYCWAACATAIINRFTL